MSIDLKPNNKLDLSLPEPPPLPPDPEEASPEEIQEYKLIKNKLMIEEKYKVDFIDALGASTTDAIGIPFNFISHSNFIIYKVGRHLIIKDCPPDNEVIFTEKEMNKQGNSFFIYLSPETKKVTSMQVSFDKNNFVISEEIEDNTGKNYSSISMYYMDKLNIETFYMITPTRKIMTDKFYNFRSLNFSENNKFLCAICKEKISQKDFGIIYDITIANKFEMNKAEPYIIIDLLKENMKTRLILNENIEITFNKISLDKNNILCVSGENNINFWYIYNTIIGQIPLILNKNYNFVDHAFYKFTKEQKLRDEDNLMKHSVLFAITSSNELYIFQSTQKSLDNKIKLDLGDEMNILSGYSGIEQFIVKFHADNIFNNVLCHGEKIAIINTVFFNGILIGNDLGDIVIYEKVKKDDIFNFDYVFIKKYEKKENLSRCTCISLNFNESLALIAFEKNEVVFVTIKNLINSIKNNSEENTLPILYEGYHHYPLKTFDVSIQRPILVTSSFSDNKIKLWNFLSGYSEYCKIKLTEGQKFLAERFVILALALHPNGYNIVISNEEMIWFFLICHNEVRFYGNEVNEISGNKNANKRIILQKRNNCYLLKFMNGGDKLIAVNNSKNLFIIDTFTREVKNCFHLNHAGIINDVAFSEDNKYIYTFGSDGYIYEINVETEDLERIVTEIITYTQGFIFSSFEPRDITINNKTESKKQRYHNIIACGHDVKDSYSITEITYIPTALNIQQKEFEVISSDITFIKEQVTCFTIITPKKLEKKCIVCGTKNGKIVIYPYPVKDAKNKFDEVLTHSGKVTKLHYIREINMLISSGEDGNFFIYSLFEILGDTILYEKNFDDIYRLNTALDVSLGVSFLFPVIEMEKIELIKNEEKEAIKRFEEEKEKIGFDHKTRKKNVVIEFEEKTEEEKNELKKKIEELEIIMKSDEEKLKKELDDKNNDLVSTLKNDIRNNYNKLYDYQLEIKSLKEKLESSKLKYNKDIEQKRKDYANKYKEIREGFKDKIISLLKEQKELKEKCSNEKKEKKAFINNIEKETFLEEKMRSAEQKIKLDAFDIDSRNLNYDIIKYNDIIERQEKRLKELKKIREDLEIKMNYLEKKLDEYRKNNSNLILEKEHVIEEFKDLQNKIQNYDSNYELKKKLRIDLYKQKYEFTSIFNETAIENSIEGNNNKSLSKNIINLTNKVFSTVRDKNRALSQIELVKKENERLRTEVNVNHQKLDKIIRKIYQSFQTNSKNEVVKCLCEIYKSYVNDDFVKKREKKLLNKNVIIELENQINVLEDQVSINKSHIKRMINKHDVYKEEKLKENSILLNRFSKDKDKSQSLEKSIISLRDKSKLLNNEVNKMKNEVNNSSMVTSNNGSKELRKNVSTINVLPKINLYKIKNFSSALPSSIMRADNEENSGSKKGSFFNKSIDSKILNSNISIHTNIIE